MLTGWISKADIKQGYEPQQPISLQLSSVRARLECLMSRDVKDAFNEVNSKAASLIQQQLLSLTLTRPKKAPKYISKVWRPGGVSDRVNCNGLKSLTRKHGFYTLFASELLWQLVTH